MYCVIVVWSSDDVELCYFQYLRNAAGAISSGACDCRLQEVGVSRYTYYLKYVLWGQAVRLPLFWNKVSFIARIPVQQRLPALGCQAFLVRTRKGCALLPPR